MCEEGRGVKGKARKGWERKSKETDMKAEERKRKQVHQSIYKSKVKLDCLMLA